MRRIGGNSQAGFTPPQIFPNTLSHSSLAYVPPSIVTNPTHAPHVLFVIHFKKVTNGRKVLHVALYLQIVMFSNACTVSISPSV